MTEAHRTTVGDARGVLRVITAAPTSPACRAAPVPASSALRRLLDAAGVRPGPCSLPPARPEATGCWQMAHFGRVPGLADRGADRGMGHAGVYFARDWSPLLGSGRRQDHGGAEERD